MPWVVGIFLLIVAIYSYAWVKVLFVLILIAAVGVALFMVGKGFVQEVRELPKLQTGFIFKPDPTNPHHIAIVTIVAVEVIIALCLITWTPAEYLRYDAGFLNANTSWGCLPGDILQGKNCYSKIDTSGVGAGKFAVFCFSLAFAVIAYLVFFKSNWHKEWLSKKLRAEREEKDRLETEEKTRLHYEEWANYNPPTQLDFINDVTKTKPVTGLATIFNPIDLDTSPFDARKDIWAARHWKVAEVEKYYQETLQKAVWYPVIIPDATRFAGTWIVAPPGRGKTNLLHHMIGYDRNQKATVVLMDSKGDMINSYRGYDDVVLIEPSTVQINPFQLGTSTRTLDFLEYIFSALLETKLTGKQTTLFRCVLALMLQIPNATIETFRRVLVHGWKDYEPYVMRLDEDNCDFFYVEGRKSEFDGGQYQETKQEVLQRLRLLVSNHYLKQIFTAPTTNTNFFELLDSGKTIIIDNSKDELGENGAEFFGRFFVALVWMAAVSRSKLRPDQKVPVYFYIDECHTVIKRDTKITTILDECRSQKIALILAHQRVAQIEAPVLDALANCAIRIANSDDDAEALSKRFRVEPEALRLPIGSFCCFVRDQTPQGRTVSVPEFDMSTFPNPQPEARPSPPPRAPNPPKTSLRIVPKDDLDFG